jgi:serine/threonine protein kinase
LEIALRIAHSIAAATEQLHSRSILHGDLYAHNILSTETGEALLGDFGAACFFPLQEPDTALSLQQLEARAVGCLLEELLERCEAPAAAQGTVEALWDLQRQCVQPTVAARPLLAEIHHRLMQLQEAAALLPGA